MIRLDEQKKVSVNAPFPLLANQYEVLKELAEMTGEPLSEYIRWSVIKTVEMDIEELKGGGAGGRGLHKKLEDKWGLDSSDWPDEVDEKTGT